MLQKQAQKIDKVIGRNIRIHRLAKKMSQTELGEKLGVSFQQVQKYENGTNRVGSGRCFRSPRSSASTSARFSRAAEAAKVCPTPACSTCWRSPNRCASSVHSRRSPTIWSAAPS